METKLRKPEVSHYTVADHFEFHEVSYETCAKYSQSLIAQAMIEAYYRAFEQESIIYKWMKKSEYTEEKAKVDQKRNSVYIGMKEIVVGNTRNFDSEVVKAAEHILRRLDNYGDVPHLGYDAQTAATESIIQHLNSPAYQEAVTLLNLEPWIHELTVLNKAFKTLVFETQIEHTEKPGISSKDARRQTDLALRAITDNITSRINLEGPAQFIPFIKNFNTMVDHYNTVVHEHYGRLHVRTDITPAEIADIPHQKHTGRPIHVIPDLTLVVTEKDGTKKTVYPEFSVDFTVTYEHNVDRGTAHVIISGIGKYVGTTDTVFQIV
ncbi:MAG: DUF6261 family protein [Dysgonamonadaceae bacterium]|jgi:hypothetical protein|nr:DUF6261 family protein [Dysgonamonadaceae bacterium]